MPSLARAGRAALTSLLVWMPALSSSTTRGTSAAGSRPPRDASRSSDVSVRSNWTASRAAAAGSKGARRRVVGRGPPREWAGGGGRGRGLEGGRGVPPPALQVLVPRPFRRPGSDHEYPVGRDGENPVSSR